jgi:peptidoglycan/LPS O-acetylase OafA/YrhL
VQKLNALTALRFFAALAIVVLHSKAAFHANAWIDSWIPLEYGVSFFFVLSGFILTYTHPQTGFRASDRSFYIARFARVWPLHVVTFALCLMLIPERARLAPDGFYTIIANLSLVHAWIPVAGFFYSYNAVSWSISVEAFFYLCFPFLLRNLDRTWHWKLLSVAALAAGLLTLATVLHVPGYDPAAPFAVSTTGLAYTSPIVRLFEFLLGMVTARAYVRYAPIINLRATGWTLIEIGAFLTIPLLCWLSQQTAIKFAVTDVQTSAWGDYLKHAAGAPAFAAVVFVCAIGRGFISKALSWRPLVVLGEASFALYLVHQIFIGWYYMNIPMLVGIPNVVMFVVYWVACMVASLALWRYVETPARRIIRSRLATYSSKADPS